MLDFFTSLHGTLLNSFYAHPVAWWGALALTTAGGIVFGYVSAKRDAKASGR
jgi:hypothetical protein